jgi:phosphoenolpyruvate carboxykinase (ATP)
MSSPSTFSKPCAVPSHGQSDQTLLACVGLKTNATVYYQLPVAQLVEHAIQRNEAILASNGALVVNTGKYTGRSPNDRFIVDTQGIHDDIGWGKVNKPLPKETYEHILNKVKAYLFDKPLYVFDGFAGADRDYSVNVRFINEWACQNLFVHQMFIRPTPKDLPKFQPDFTLICAPGFKLDPTEDGVNSEAAIILNLEEKVVLVVATDYSGEMKKSIFSILNYLLPQKGVFPMHCSVNTDMLPESDSVPGRSAIFFGLSGTGKTTLSADPERILIGDDEHGWSDKGLFNFEGGCYAKAIRLSKENEPEIWDAIRFGAVCENVILDPETRIPDYDDGTLTENTRVAYPINYIPNADPKGLAPHPSAIIFLTADAFGVLPPISKLTEEQAQYHFISGYTSKLAGTERGIVEPQAAFSSCFGEPFMPRPPLVYAELLKSHIQAYKVSVFLVNTGWQGGGYGVGKRVSIPHTRAMIRAALSGSLDSVPTTPDPVFGFHVPSICPGVPSEILNPKSQWTDSAAYDATARKLADMFIANFTQFPDAQHLDQFGPKSASK